MANNGYMRLKLWLPVFTAVILGLLSVSWANHEGVKNNQLNEAVLLTKVNTLAKEQGELRGDVKVILTKVLAMPNPPAKQPWPGQ